METTLDIAASKPHPQAVWLRRSIAWTLACVAGWLLLCTGLTAALGVAPGLDTFLLLGTAGAAHLLIWYKAVLSSPVAPDVPEPFWLTTLSACWTFSLLLFQVLCLLLWFLGLILACDTHGSTWN